MRRGEEAAGLTRLRALVAASLSGGLALALADGPGAAAPAPPKDPSVAPGTRGSPGTAGPIEADDPHALRVQALVALAQRGDSEAFAQIYDLYVDQVYRYLYYRLGAHALAEDLTSETFLRALRRIGSFTWQGRDIGAWFMTIARNLVADHVKSSRFKLEVSTADMIDADRAEAGVEEVVLAQLDNTALANALKTLKPEQQECLTLRFLQGLSVAETALVMGRSEGAIKQLQLRAVRTLARLLVPSQRGGPAPSTPATRRNRSGSPAGLP